MNSDNDGWKDLLIAQGHDMDTVEELPATSLPGAHDVVAEYVQR